MRIVLPALCGALVIVGCRGGEDAMPGDVVIQWTGDGKEGEAILPARGTLCRETGLLEVLAVRGDTGFGLVLFPPDSAQAAPLDYRVFEATTDPEPRPGANVAIRWLDESTLLAYEGTGGSVRLGPAPSGAISGALDALLRAVERSETLRVTGRFDAVPLDTAGAGCAGLHRRDRI